MKPLLTFIGLTFFVSASQAATFSLETTTSEPLYQTTLTKEVYQTSDSNHLKGLSVTNADGESVPYALAPYGNVYLESKTSEESKPLVIFPIQEDTLAQSDDMSIQLNSHDNQTSVSVTAKDANTAAKVYYLFDLGKKHPTFKKLTLDWQGQEGQLLTVDVLTSNNLKDWTTVGQAALLKVANDDQAILQNTITLDHLIKSRYLKIQPQDAADNFGLTSVNIAVSHKKALSLPLVWQTIASPQRSQKDTATHIDFESMGRYPAEYLNISLPQSNTITQVTVLTRNNKNESWRRVTRTSLYRINKNDKEYANKDIHIPKTTARYWRLTFNQANGGIGKKSPQLSLGWLPDILIWNARGPSPYHLNTSDTSGAANMVPMANLLKPYASKKVKDLPVANLRLISNEKTNNTWSAPTNYKRLWLWGGLLLGVLALAIMAFSLIKQDSNK